MTDHSQLGSGIIRTESGRQTYAPDGIASNADSSNAYTNFSHGGNLQRKPSQDDLKSASDDEKDSDVAGKSNDEDRDAEKGDAKKEESDSKDDDEEKDPNVVDWDGEDDKENPMNFPPARKWIMAISMGLMTLVVTFASSVFSSATMVTAQQFGVSSEVMILGLALFVLGFAFGPIVWVIFQFMRVIFTAMQLTTIDC
jgi:uncharacterized membrane protein YdbT with pleckstrin-like domain